MRKGLTVLRSRTECPENCRYRNKLAPFCGYCMLEILSKKKEESDGQGKKESAGQAGKEGL